MAPERADDLAAVLSSLRKSRQHRQHEARGQRRRRSLNAAERELVLGKTAQRCHICGGEVGPAWQADHVLAHSAGGSRDAENYLAAHLLCNNYRWDYLPQEFQWILKIGVWARTHMERRTRLGREMAEAFVKNEARRERRRKPGG